MRKLMLALVSLLLMTSCETLQKMNTEKAMNAGTAAVNAFTITDAQITSLCKEYMVANDKENTVLPASNTYTKRLDRIMARFKNIDNLNLNYAVYQSQTVNAFASGDGSVRVYSGLMDVMTDDEVFAVIGHELGHLINKDVRDSYRAAYLVVAARYGISAINENASLVTEGLIGDLAQELATSAYSRMQEYQADEMAFQFCITNNVDPYAMYKALNVLISLDKNQNTNIASKLFSSHPETAKRAARIKSMADAVKK